MKTNLPVYRLLINVTVIYFYARTAWNGSVSLDFSARLNFLLPSSTPLWPTLRRTGDRRWNVRGACRHCLYTRYTRTCKRRRGRVWRKGCWIFRRREPRAGRTNKAPSWCNTQTRYPIPLVPSPPLHPGSPSVHSTDLGAPRSGI